MTPPRTNLTGVFLDMTNAEYHAAPGLNKSKLDMIMEDPAMAKWVELCPIDDEKLKTLDFGSAFHTAVLEPELFDGLYAVEPDVDRRTNTGKAAIKDFYELHGNKTIITAAEYKKIKLMAGSAMAHPAIRLLIQGKTGVEVSIFVEDPDTGLIMKSRNDLETSVNGLNFICDLKTIDSLDRIPNNIHDFNYHVQEAHYKEVYRLHHGKYPDGFLFIFCSKTIECGRYPVRVIELDEDTKEIGKEKWMDAVTEYQRCQTNNHWPGVCVSGLPGWAYRRQS